MSTPPLANTNPASNSDDFTNFVSTSILSEGELEFFIESVDEVSDHIRSYFASTNPNDIEEDFRLVRRLYFETLIDFLNNYEVEGFGLDLDSIFNRLNDLHLIHHDHWSSNEEVGEAYREVVLTLQQVVKLICLNFAEDMSISQVNFEQLMRYPGSDVVEVDKWLDYISNFTIYGERLENLKVLTDEFQEVCFGGDTEDGGRNQGDYSEENTDEHSDQNEDFTCDQEDCGMCRPDNDMD